MKFDTLSMHLLHKINEWFSLIKMYQCAAVLHI